VLILRHETKRFRVGVGMGSLISRGSRDLKSVHSGRLTISHNTYSTSTAMLELSLHIAN